MEKEQRPFYFPVSFPFFSLASPSHDRDIPLLRSRRSAALSVPCTDVNSNLFWVTHDLPVGLGSPHSRPSSAVISSLPSLSFSVKELCVSGTQWKSFVMIEVVNVPLEARKSHTHSSS